MKSLKFRVQNFRNIEDSGWVNLESVTALVGRNESGKTALLKALHKFNPATDEPYDPLTEFPRDRLRSEYQDGRDWPVCSVLFELGDKVREQLRALGDGPEPPRSVEVTRFYDGSLEYTFEPAVVDAPVSPATVLNALAAFATSARRLRPIDGYDEEALAPLRGQYANWADERRAALLPFEDSRSPEAMAELQRVVADANNFSNPLTAEMVESVTQAAGAVLAAAKIPPVDDRAWEIVRACLPVFIYFENYGVLDSAVYLPRLLEDMKVNPRDERVRTVNAMFKHVKLPAEEIFDLGREEVTEAQAKGSEPTAEMLERDRQRKDRRAIYLNAASLDITKRFAEWWQQRRHKISYQADGPYFRIWVSDDRRPDVDLELESRSKGFQWFFSFYLVFLVESEEGYKDAILLLDEPGLHLHPTAQQELIGFFETLSATNPIVYSTHSPFLIDPQRIHRVRPVVESESGISHISNGTWPADRDTIFPLQAAAGYQMMQDLFKHRKNVLVEGLSDYLYIYAFSLALVAKGKPGLPDDVHVVPCGGTQMVTQIAALFLGEQLRPVVILDADSAGRGRRTSLLKNLYAGRERAIIGIDEVLGVTTDCEFEDLLDEASLLGAVKELVGRSLSLAAEDRNAGTLPDQIAHAATRKGVVLPDGWRADAARRIVAAWAANPPRIPESVLQRAETLINMVKERAAETEV